MASSSPKIDWYTWLRQNEAMEQPTPKPTPTPKKERQPSRLEALQYFKSLQARLAKQKAGQTPEGLDTGAYSASIIPGQRIAKEYSEIPWSYRNPPVNPVSGKPVNQFGNELPDGATSFTPQGDPYFGPGIGGRFKYYGWKLKGEPWGSKTKKSQASISVRDPFGGTWSFEHDPTKPVSMGGLTWGQGYSESDVKLAAGVKTAGVALMDIFSEPAIKTKQAISVLEKINADFEKTFASRLEEKFPKVDWNRVLVSDTARRIGEVSENYFEENFSLNTLKEVFAGEAPFLKKGGGLDTAYQAGRMYWTYFKEPMKRQEFSRRYAEGEDPQLLALELQNPIAEMIGEVIVDPLNLFPSHKIKEAKRIGGARDLFVALPAELDAVKDFAKNLDIATPEKLVAWFQDDLVQSQVIVQQQIASKRFAQIIENHADAKGLLAMTVEGRRAVLSKWMSVVTGGIRGASDDPDEALSILKAMIDLGSGDADRIATAMPTILMSNNPRLFLSYAGQLYQRSLYNLVDGDVEKFARTMQKVLEERPFESFLEEVAKRMNKSIDDLVPSYGERIEGQKLFNAITSQNKKVGEFVKVGGNEIEVTQDVLDYANKIGKMTPITSFEEAIWRFHKASQSRIYGPAMNFFSGVYMGLSWRYAIRNAFNNYFTSFIDEGVGAVFGSAENAEELVRSIYSPLVGFRSETYSRKVTEDAIRRLIDFVPEGAQRAIMSGGPSAGTTGRAKRLFGILFAENFERDSAVKVTYAAVRQALDTMLTQKNLPNTGDLIAAGLPKEVANSIWAILASNNYDPRKTVNAIKSAVRSGNENTFRMMTWIDKRLFNDLSKWGLRDEIVRIIQNEELDTPEKIIERIGEIRERLARMADRVDEEVPLVSLSDVVGGQLPAIVESLGDLSQNIDGSVNTWRTASIAVAEAYENILRTFSRALAASPEFSKNPEAIELVDRIDAFARYGVKPYLDAHGQVTVKAEVLAHNRSISNNAVSIEYSRLFSEAINPITYRDGTTDEVSTYLIDLIKELGKDAPAPTSRKYLASAVWENYWYPRMKAIWSAWNDRVASESEAIIDIVKRKYPGMMQSNILEAIRRAREGYSNLKDLDEWIAKKELWKTFEVSSPSTKIAIIAKMNGISSASKKGASADRALLNIINKNLPDNLKRILPNGKYDFLDDVPLAVADDAFKYHVGKKVKAAMMADETPEEIAARFEQTVTDLKAYSDKAQELGNNNSDAVRLLDDYNANYAGDITTADQADFIAKVEKEFPSFRLGPGVSRELFHGQFKNFAKSIGLSNEMTDVVIELFETRAKIWASLKRGRNPEDWFSMARRETAALFEAGERDITDRFKSPLRWFITEKIPENAKINLDNLAAMVKKSQERGVLAEWNARNMDWEIEHIKSLSASSPDLLTRDGFLAYMEGITFPTIRLVERERSYQIRWIVEDELALLDDGFLYEKVQTSPGEWKPFMSDMYGKKAAETMSDLFEYEWRVIDTSQGKRLYTENQVPIPGDYGKGYKQGRSYPSITAAARDAAKRDWTPEYLSYYLGGENEGVIELTIAMPEYQRYAMPPGAGAVPYEVDVTSHAYTDKNIIGWLRCTVRKDSEGRRILLMEEIQSDWYQLGEKFGYDEFRVVNDPDSNKYEVVWDTIQDRSLGHIGEIKITDVSGQEFMIPQFLISDETFPLSMPKDEVAEILIKSTKKALAAKNKGVTKHITESYLPTGWRKLKPTNIDDIRVAIPFVQENTPPFNYYFEKPGGVFNQFAGRIRPIYETTVIKGKYGGLSLPTKRGFEARVSRDEIRSFRGRPGVAIPTLPAIEKTEEFLTYEEAEEFVYKFIAEEYENMIRTYGEEMTRYLDNLYYHEKSGLISYSMGGRFRFPPGPYQKDWIELLTRRLISYAAQEDFDGIAFATSDVPAHLWQPEIVRWVQAYGNYPDKYGATLVSGALSSRTPHPLPDTWVVENMKAGGGALYERNIVRSEAQLLRVLPVAYSYPAKTIWKKMLESPVAGEYITRVGGLKRTYDVEVVKAAKTTLKRNKFRKTELDNVSIPIAFHDMEYSKYADLPTTPTPYSFPAILFDDYMDVHAAWRPYLYEMFGDEAKGMMRVSDDGMTIIRGLTSPDIRTVLHEIGHLFRNDIEGTPELRALSEFAGVGRSGKWSTAAEEKVAESFVKWIEKGGKTSLPAFSGEVGAQIITPSRSDRELDRAFSSLARWLSELYATTPGRKATPDTIDPNAMQAWWNIFSSSDDYSPVRVVKPKSRYRKYRNVNKKYDGTFTDISKLDPESRDTIRIAVEQGRYSLLPPDLQDEISLIVGRMRKDLDSAQLGRRVRHVDEAAVRGEDVSWTSEVSTYPRWYTHELPKNIRYTSADGANLTAIKAVEAALDDMMDGRARPTVLVKSLSAIVKVEADCVSAPLFARYVLGGEFDMDLFLQAIDAGDANLFSFYVDALIRFYPDGIPSHIESSLDNLYNRAASSMGASVLRDAMSKSGKSGEVAIKEESELLKRLRKEYITYQTGQEAYSISFEDDIEKMLFYIASPHLDKGKKAEYMNFLSKEVGWSRSEIMRYAREVYRETRSQIREVGKKPKTPYSGGAPTPGRIIRESESEINAMFSKLEEGVRNHFNDRASVVSNPIMDSAIKSWSSALERRVNEAKVTAAWVGNTARDFALHDYRMKYGIDTALSYIFPFHFWYSRTYLNWMQRMLYNPQVIAAYAKYRDALGMIHANSPEWYRYNLDLNEVLGIDSEEPLLINIENTLNPLYGITGVDFDDEEKYFGDGTAWKYVSQLMDKIDNFGPTPWTMYAWVLGAASLARGENIAAQKWFGRLIPQTKDFRNLLSVLNVQGPALGTLGQYNDYDPFIAFASGGVDPYDQRMAVRALGWMQEEGEYSPEDVIDTSRTLSGPIWDEAVRRAIEYRATGGLEGVARPIPFLMSQIGVGFRPRTGQDLLIDKYYTDKSRLIKMKQLLSPEQYRNAWEVIRIIYPFADALSIGRGDKWERDEGYAYNVLSRVPPGQRDNLFKFLGVDYEMIERFYQTKGETLKEWNESDRNRFISAVLDIGAVLSLPDDATREKWRRVTNIYNQLQTALTENFGEDIHIKISRYFDQRDAGKGDEFLEDNPDVEKALDFKSNWYMSSPEMTPYYMSIDNIERYYNALAKEAIDIELGTNMEYLWNMYDMAKSLGSGEEFWKRNPELEKYIELKRKYDKFIAKHVSSIYDILGDIEHPLVRAQKAGESIGAGDLRNYLQTTEEAKLPYEYTASEWQQIILNPPLWNLVVDSALHDKDLPYEAEQQLEYIGNQLGIYNTDLIIELIRKQLEK